MGLASREKKNGLQQTTLKPFCKEKKKANASKKHFAHYIMFLLPC